MSEQIKKEFDDFTQDMYDEEELQYMDSGFVNALQSAFSNGWQASRQSIVVKLPDICDLHPQKMLKSEVIKKLDAAGVKYE